MGHCQTRHRRLRDGNQRESALSNPDVDPARSALPSPQNLGRRQSLLRHLRNGKPRQTLLPNLRLGGRWQLCVTV